VDNGADVGRHDNRADRKAARKHSTKLLVIDRAFQVLRTAIKSAATIYGLYLGHELIKALANGRINWTPVLLALVKGNVAWALLIVIALVSLVVAIDERRLRKTLIKQLSPYIKELEGRIDARRSSSKLNSDGTTRREDLDAS
jgi:hypothetical protein